MCGLPFDILTYHVFLVMINTDAQTVAQKEEKCKIKQENGEILC